MKILAIGAPGRAEWRPIAIPTPGTGEVLVKVAVLALVVSGQLQLAPLATHTLPLARYPEGVALLRTHQAVNVRFLLWLEDDGG